jgi:hypothetical protein
MIHICNFHERPSSHLRRSPAGKVHQQTGRLAPPAVRLLGHPHELVVLLVFLVLLAVFELEHHLVVRVLVLSDEPDLPRVRPQLVLLVLGHPALDEDVAGFLLIVVSK